MCVCGVGGLAMQLRTWNLADQGSHLTSVCPQPPAGCRRRCGRGSQSGSQPMLPVTPLLCPAAPAVWKEQLGEAKFCS